MQKRGDLPVDALLEPADALLHGYALQSVVCGFQLELFQVLVHLLLVREEKLIKSVPLAVLLHCQLVQTALKVHIVVL